MDTCVLLLLTSYLSTSLDNFFIYAETSDLVLVKNIEKVWCVAKGDTVYSALSWTSTSDTSVYQTRFNGLGSPWDCNLVNGKHGCQKWHGWNLENSLKYYMPPVLDYRWDDLGLVTTNGEPYFMKVNAIQIEYQNDVWEITLSVAAEKDVYISLCKDKSPDKSECYWIILGGWAGDKTRGSAIRRCPKGLKNPNGDCKDSKSLIRDKVVKGGNWVLVTLKLQKTAEDLTLEVYDKNGRILNWTDPKPFDLNYFNVRSDKNEAHYRIHNYTFLLGREKDFLASDFFEPTSALQCWSIVYNFQAKLPEDVLEVHMQYSNSQTYEVIKKLSGTEWEWKLETFTFNATGEMRLVIVGKGDNEFAVGGIKECNGDTLMSMIEYYKDDSSLTCQALKYPEKDVRLTSRLNTEYFDCEDCTMNCKRFGIPDFQNKPCFGTSLCKNVGSRSVCFCSSGYEGDSCNVACSERQRYGVNCKFDCGKCKSNKCDQVNGTCYGGCDDGYRLPMCKNRYLTFIKPPEKYGSYLMSIAVYISNFNTAGDGTPAYYKLQYVLASDIDVDEWKTEGTYIFNIGNLYNVTGLQPATEYAFRAVIIDKDNGSYSGRDIPYSVYRTNCSHPENPEVEAQRDSISMNWEVTVNHCPVKNYTLVVQEDGMTSGSESSISLPFIVKGLKPFKNYTWILEYNGEEIKRDNKETLEDVPSKVRSLAVVEETQDSLRISWERPENPNGNIKYYLVQYEHCKYLACVNNRCTSSEQINVTSTDISLNNLKPYSQYNIAVKAFTIGYGEETSITVNTSGLGTLEIMPEFLKDYPIVKEREVELQWTLDCTSVGGKIEGFVVTLRGLSEWADKSDKIQMVSSDNKNAVFEHLHPNSKYTVSILVNGINGPAKDEYALVEEFTTKPDRPEKVRNPVPYSFGENWIYLRWEEPYPPTGELEIYEVHYANNPSRQVNVDDYCKIWKNMICAELDNLQRDIEYTVRIAAKNKDVLELGDAETLTVTTTQGVPDRPVNVTVVVVSSQKIKLSWKHPNVTRGKLKRFEANVTLQSTGLRKPMPYIETKPLMVDDDEPEYILEIDDLYPTSHYRIDVYGITIGAGENSTVECETPVSTPDIGSHLALIQDSVTSTTFKVKIPDYDRFLTNSSAYILIVTSEKIVQDHELALKFKEEQVRENVLKEAEIINKENSWIAAEIKPGNIKHFLIGDNKTQKSGMQFVEYARNRPLSAGSKYQATLIAVNSWKNEYKYSNVKLGKAVQTLCMDSSDGDSSVAAWVVSILLIFCILVLLFWFIKRRRVREKQENGILDLKMSDTYIVPDSSSVVEPESAESKLPPSQRFSRRVAISDLEEYVKTGLISGELQRQHELFPRGQTRPWDYGRLPENKTKNRYGNLVAYDATRVKLKKLAGDEFSDYINANYINGYNSPRFYIATQGPRRNTVVDFWRMIWQEHVQVIVMLANLIEDSKVKCEKYWPEYGQEVTHGAITVLNASYQVFADYTFRQLNVTCKGKTRKVQHLHFTSWPDHGVPMYPQSLSSFLKKLLAISPGSGPITVHCSAGVGRTGTVILSDICLRMAAAEGYVDILSFLQQIREQRANMVDNLDQYKLVHLVLLECLVTESTSYPCDGSFEKRVQELSSSGTIEKQFNHLYNIRWQDEALSPPCEIALSASHTDTSKNRNLDIVPGPNGRVFMSPFPYDDPNSDYINAVYVDGFRAKDQFIVTQFPLESTLGDFWRLIVEKKASVIVVLNEIEEENKSVCQFWSSGTSDSINPVPHITVTKKQERNSKHWKTHDMHIVSGDAEEEKRTLHILHLKDWRSDEKLPPSTSVILELWQEAERLYSGTEPIVVCCLDGATACGYFVALAFLIEKIKLEQQCDVCQAVRTVRQNREQLVGNRDQFEYLYKAAVTYLDAFQIYANFN